MATKQARSLRKKAGSYHHGNLREALLLAAMKRIAQSQDFDFRLRDLAQDCGVRLAACYRHFPAKHDVLVAIAARGFVAMGEALASVEGAASGASLLEELGIAYIVFARAHPVYYLAMFHPSLTPREGKPELLESAAKALNALRRAVEAALQTAGQSAPSSLTLDAVFRAWAVVHGYSSLLVAREPSPSSPMFRRANDAGAIAAYVRAVTPGVLAVLAPSAES